MQVNSSYFWVDKFVGEKRRKEGSKTQKGWSKENSGNSSRIKKIKKENKDTGSRAKR